MATGAVLLLALIAFTLSASAGLGGSLILVPGLVLIVGPREGVALAALLLASNNVGKVLAYRNSVPLPAVSAVLVSTVVGAAIGARLLVEMPENVVLYAVIVGIVATVFTERFQLTRVRQGLAPLLAFAAGAFSGFTGTSGPLKGAALRNLQFDRRSFVGAASAVSLAADLTKVVVFFGAGVVVENPLPILLPALPLIVIAVLLGRRINNEIGERGYAVLFWIVMAGYSVRLVM